MTEDQLNDLIQKLECCAESMRNIWAILNEHNLTDSAKNAAAMVLELEEDIARLSDGVLR
jgi:uncharacterized protein YecE (DUF72 family)